MYLPLARRYRPKDFDGIVGQDHIIKTLKNAILLDKLAHAYLFTGARGIGKTSTARILSKSLNCEKGPTQKPCNKCTSCLEITKGISLDVLEIDGASNRGIDEIRNLRENVKLKPAKGIYRIYIIDEVHMLTPEAFNALLKTLEEPPPHAKFIFATTMAHKVLPTIASRCQRFDFRMISHPVLMEQLKEIAKQEKIIIENDALFSIAKNASGSLRDGLMMLDQLASFAKGKISASDVSKVFGTLEQDALIKITEAILNNETKEVLKILHDLLNSGRDPMFIAASLVEHYRNLIIFSLSKDADSHVLMDEANRKKLKDLSAKFTVNELFYSVYALSSTMDFIGRTTLGKIPLEITLLKLSRKQKMLSIDEVVKKIGQIENLLTDKKIPIEQLNRNQTYIPPVKIDKQKPEPVNINSESQKAEEPVVEQISSDGILLRLKGIWPEIVREVKEKKISIGSYLEEGILLDLKDNKVIIGFSKASAFHKEVLDTKPNKIIISAAIKHLLGTELLVELVTTDAEPQNLREDITSSPIEETREEPTYEKVDPIIRTAMGVFNGRVIKKDFIKREDRK